MSDATRRGLADLALILEEMSVSEVCRIAPRTRAFVTGSRAYGRFDAYSDVDLVVLVSEADREILRETMHEQWMRHPEEVFGLGDRPRWNPPNCRELPDDLDTNPFNYPVASVKFGKLNVLLCTDPIAFECWYVGTQELKTRKPVTREEAIRVFYRLRGEYGLDQGEDPTSIRPRTMLEGAVEA